MNENLYLWMRGSGEPVALRWWLKWHSEMRHFQIILEQLPLRCLNNCLRNYQKAQEEFEWWHCRSDYWQVNC